MGRRRSSIRLNREGSALPEAINLLLLENDAAQNEEEKLSPAQKRYLPGIGKKWVRTKNNVAVRLSRQGSGREKEERSPGQNTQQSSFFFGNYDNLQVQDGLFLRTSSAP